MTTVLVTGAGGFVGTHLCTILEERGYSVRRAVRTLSVGASDQFEIGDIDGTTDWQHALNGVDAVVHLAARVHVLSESSADPLTAFRTVNTAATEKLAQQSLDAGIRRLVYISSVKACAATTDRAQLEADTPRPSDPYGQSKFEAEEALLKLAATSQLEPVIIRPPLVYGPGVGANFLRLLRVVDKGMPLPLSGIDNRRSLVSVYNLCDLIVTCLRHPNAAGEVFNVTDGKDLSISGLLHAIGQAMDRRPRLFYFPSIALRLMFRLIGRADDFDRLCSSLQLNIDKAGELLHWTPPVPMAEGMRRTVSWYRKRPG